MLDKIKNLLCKLHIHNFIGILLQDKKKTVVNRGVNYKYYTPMTEILSYNECNWCGKTSLDKDW